MDRVARAVSASAGGIPVVAAPAEVADETVYVKVSDHVRAGGRERLRVRALRLVGNQVVALYVVAVLTHAASVDRRILVTVVPVSVPPGGVVSRELLMIAAERAVGLETERLGLPAPVGALEEALDSRFLRRARRESGDDLARVVSDTRQRRVGDVVVSVSMACLEEEEDEVAGHADVVAESVRGVVGGLGGR